MIVYTRPFIASAAAAGQPLNLPRIGHQTYTQGALPADVTASTDQVSFPKDAPLRPGTYEFWQPTALPATWVLDFNGVKSIDYVGIAAHNLFTCAASVKVETQLGAGAYTLFAADLAPGDNTPIMFVGDAVNCNRVRLTISGLGAKPSLGVIYVGAALVMERPVSTPYTPISLARETTLKNTFSRSGQFLGQDFRRNGVVNDIAFSDLSAAFIRNSFNAFAKAARKFPYFCTWCPLYYPLEVGYVWTDKDIRPKYQGMRDMMQVSWNMVGAAGAE
jgi:hypothetical protein